MIAVSRSLMPAPPGASFLRHGPPHHHFSICCPFVKILSALHKFGHSYHPAICQNSFSSFGHWGLGSCRIHPLIPPELGYGEFVFVAGWRCVRTIGDLSDYFFSQMGVVPTQITCNAPRSKTMGTSRTIHQIYNPHFEKKKVQLSNYASLFFAKPGTPSLISI